MSSIDDVRNEGAVTKETTTSYTKLLEDALQGIDPQLYGLPRPYYNFLASDHGNSCHNDSSIQGASHKEARVDGLDYSPWLDPPLNSSMNYPPIYESGCTNQISDNIQHWENSADENAQPLETTCSSQMQPYYPYGSFPVTYSGGSFSYNDVEGMDLSKESKGSVAMEVRPTGCLDRNQDTFSHIDSLARSPPLSYESPQFGGLSPPNSKLPFSSGFFVNPASPMSHEPAAASSPNRKSSTSALPATPQTFSHPPAPTNSHNPGPARRKRGRPVNATNNKGRGENLDVEFHRVYNAVLRNPNINYNPEIHGGNRKFYESARRKMHYNRRKQR